MYYILMHKNTQVAYCKDANVIKVLKTEMLPIGTSQSGKKTKTYNLSHWLSSRTIPNTRTNYSEIKNQLLKNNITEEKFAVINYGISLIDSYWMYPVSNAFAFTLFGNKKYVEQHLPRFEELVLYTNDTNPIASKDGFLKTLSDGKIITKDIIQTKIPDNTTSGNVLKYWVIRNNEFFLVKQNSPEKPLTAEKTIIAQVLCDIINNVRYNTNNKKPYVDVASYFYEPGKQPMQSCCYNKCCTNESKGLTSYKMIEIKNGKEMTIQEMREYINPTSMVIREYFDFIILFCYLTESKMTKDDVLFFINNDSNRPIKPAPFMSFSTSFSYMNKDYERIYEKNYVGEYVNPFGMSIEEQIDYIANIDWLDNRELFDCMEELKDFLETQIDRRQLSLQNLETICNVINHKLYHIEVKKYEIAEENGLLDEENYYDNQDEENENEENENEENENDEY